MKLRGNDHYIIGRSKDSPDEIRHPDGTYILHLDENDRESFRTSLQECLNLIESMGLSQDESKSSKRPC